LTEAQLARVVADLRQRQRSEATVRSHVRNLRAFLRWAVRRQILDRVPAMPTLGRAPQGMKGRPITTEEFERMLAATIDVVGPDHAPAWQHLLAGLWHTGLRLGEALELDWTDDARLAVELGGEFPYFRIQAAAEKGRKFRLLPMAPEAGDFFRATPPSQRRGKAFRPINPKDGRMVVVVAGEQGFLRGALRALARERSLRGLGPEHPFLLIGRADGRLTLEDPATGQRVDLESFGPTNAGVFRRLLTAQGAAAR
jgi:integrase